MTFEDTLLPGLWLPAGHFRAVQPPLLPKVQLPGMQLPLQHPLQLLLQLPLQLPLQLLLQHPQTAARSAQGYR